MDHHGGGGGGTWTGSQYGGSMVVLVLLWFVIKLEQLQTGSAKATGGAVSFCWMGKPFMYLLVLEHFATTNMVGHPITVEYVVVGGGGGGGGTAGEDLGWWWWWCWWIQNRHNPICNAVSATTVTIGAGGGGGMVPHWIKMHQDGGGPIIFLVHH